MGKEDLDDAAWESQIAAEIGRLRSRINEDAVCALASRLNDGKRCRIEYAAQVVGPRALMGCVNFHARIRFYDDWCSSCSDPGSCACSSTSWLLRVPRVTSCEVDVPESLAAYLVLSEYSTLKFLETTAVPAPRAFGYGLHSDSGGGTGNTVDHRVGVSFLLIEELPGKPWNGQGVSGEDATQEEKAKIWAAVADILAELSKHPFPKAGSLGLREAPSGSDIQVEVSAMASDRFGALHPDGLGPFDGSLAYYTAFAEQYLALIADGQLYTACPVDAYLATTETQQLQKGPGQPQPHPREEKEMEGMEKFFLKHVDDKGDHMLVDEGTLDITGIIDWQMARVVPPREAFGPSLVTADKGSLCGGRVSLSADDIALRDALGATVLLGLALEREWSDAALPLAEALLKSFGFGEDWSTWRERALAEYASTDVRLQRLLHLPV
ncbi:hypothetical protein F5Y17DRAFT_466935 [Xylariaceae sp. FL0594]|nr:hypothetical protein F5Y17DRAFT_466935 [Xylariaceae sp. FL0594]